MRCVECVEKLEQGVLPAVMKDKFGTEAATLSGLDMVDDTGPLLDALRQLPRVWPMQPVYHISRQLKDMGARILVDLLQDATAAAISEEFNQRAVVATILCRESGCLLFRPHWSPQAEEEPARGTTTAAIRRRLAAAARGDWMSIVAECITELEQRAEVERLYGPRAQHGTARNPGDDLPPDVLQAAAQKARSGGVKAASGILTGGPPVPPGLETDAKVLNLYRNEPLTPEERTRLDNALEVVERLGARTKPTIRPRVASHRVACLKSAAGPGPSGFRNAFILLLHSHPQGPRTLAAWAQIWADGSVAKWAARMWTDTLCRPFFKSDSVAVRPVLCGEALLKFAVACAVQVATPGIHHACGDFQYGAGRAGGASLEVAEVRAESADDPGSPITTLDVRNAFGCIEWADALTVTAASAPKLAHCMAAMWKSHEISLWLQDERGSGWHMYVVVGSLFQGGHEAHPTWCLIIAVVVIRVRGRCAGISWIVWVYVDDITFKSSLKDVLTLLKAFEVELQRFRCELQKRKCATCLPALNGVAESDWPEELRAIKIAGLPVCNEHVTLLGTDATEHFSTAIGAMGSPIGTDPAEIRATSSRMDRAVALANACGQLAEGSPPAGGRWPAWTITRQVVCLSLCYDARVLPSSIVLPYARKVAQAAWRVAETVIGEELTGIDREQALLPVELGGLSWPDVEGTLALARLADVIERGPLLRAALAARRPHAPIEEIWALDRLDAETDLLPLAASAGVLPGSCGAPASSTADNPLRPPCPQRHLLRAYLSRAAEQRWQRLCSQSSPQAALRLHSAGGGTAGRSLVAPPQMEGMNFTDAQLRRILRWRLGKKEAACQCRAEPSAGGQRCGAPIGIEGFHCMSCMLGPCRVALHHELSNLFCSFVEEAGGRARREVFVPEFAAKKQVASADEDPVDDERRTFAVLDVWGFGCAEISDLLLDITVRNPGSAKYRPRSEQTPGWTCIAAEREKQRRYPPAAGRRVHTVALEGWGRLGAEGEAVLLTLKAAADARDHRSGHVPHGRLARWRALIDATVQRGIARCIDFCRVGPPGHAWRQRWRVM